MKILAAFLAAFLAFGFTAAAEAKSYKKKKVYRSYDSYDRYAAKRPSRRRPYSVGYNGLCQRDTGTPTSQLDFRVGCDVEEFWRRQEENAGGRR